MSLLDGYQLPAWARWLAQDENGNWWAFEHEPNEGASSWYENELGRYRFLRKDAPNPDWRDSLMRLPDKSGPSGYSFV